jgi:heme o synthase
MKDYIELTKPRITWLILMCTGIGFYFGAGPDWSVLVLLHALIGTGLLASGTAALNQWYEREADAKMRRTQGRPIPSGRVTAARAMWFGVLLSIAGFVQLWQGANLLTAFLGLATLVSYLGLYTPLKQRSPISTTVGAFPGAMPPVIGFAAAQGALTWEALVLFAILFIWQFPHFYAIAWMYRDDYARAGIRMLPVVKPDGESTARQIVFCSILLLPVSLIPTYMGMAGLLYLTGATVLGLIFLRAGFNVARDRTAVQARKVLLASVLYLPALFAFMVIDRPAGWF